MARGGGQMLGISMVVSSARPLPGREKRLVPTLLIRQPQRLAPAPLMEPVCVRARVCTKARRQGARVTSRSPASRQERRLSAPCLPDALRSGKGQLCGTKRTFAQLSGIWEWPQSCLFPEAFPGICPAHELCLTTFLLTVLLLPRPLLIYSPLGLLLKTGFLFRC